MNGEHECCGGCEAAEAPIAAAPAEQNGACTPSCNKQAYQDRVIEEKSQLDEKIAKLRVFIGGKTYLDLDGNDQILLNRQLGIMEQYSEVLDDRIKYFTS